MRKYLQGILLLLLYSYSLGQYDIGYIRQTRAVWVSTVKMLDYPSAHNLTSDELKQEYIALLDTIHNLNINTIIFQIRPAADAFFFSPYEPWSEWLTGKQGQAPMPYFDPLKFFISEAHKRHIQFHAWINPFRAIATIQYADVINTHISKTKTDWFFDYGLHRYFNPGIPEVRDYLVSVIVDIIQRYDIDGIHFDDYFYPYPIRDEKGKIVPIPDYQTFLKYNQGFDNIKDWRRNNINSFIQTIHDTIKALKPWIIFGISPNAIWRNIKDDPKGSPTRGLAAYDWLYADILLWDSLQLVDYIAPQLYLSIGHKYADFSKLLNWWSKNIKNSNLFIGTNLLGIDTSQNFNPWFSYENFIQQLTMISEKKEVKGILLYRYQTIKNNPFNINYTLKTKFFQNWALFPHFSNCDTIPPSPPKITYFKQKDTIIINWSLEKKLINDSIAFYSIYLFHITDSSITRDSVFLTSTPKIKIVSKRKLLESKDIFFIQVCAWDRWHNQSLPSNPITLKLTPNEYDVFFEEFCF